jgi:hypothetical protein
MFLIERISKQYIVHFYKKKKRKKLARYHNMFGTLEIAKFAKTISKLLLSCV